MDWDKISGELTRKLDPMHVKPAKQYGPKGDYIEGWHAMAEANRIFGFGGWSYQVIECNCVFQGPREIGQAKKPGFGVTYTARVQVTVGTVIRDDFGAGHGYDVDCGLAHESAVKEAVTDALKRALRSFGNPFGLALYDKTRENVGVDTPPFDPVAAHDRIARKLEGVKALPDLADAWKSEAQTISEITKARADLGESLTAIKDRLKAKLQAVPAELGGDEIPY